MPRKKFEVGDKVRVVKEGIFYGKIGVVQLYDLASRKYRVAVGRLSIWCRPGQLKE
ncbi:MAG: hypothetical protein PHQ43_10325 [Dehalococcoidales bacterium]|nr:hypothetical protein [Dehalococcoidales bacterium]